MLGVYLVFIRIALNDAMEIVESREGLNYVEISPHHLATQRFDPERVADSQRLEASSVGSSGSRMMRREVLEEEALKREIRSKEDQIQLAVSAMQIQSRGVEYKTSEEAASSCPTGSNYVVDFTMCKEAGDALGYRTEESCMSYQNGHHGDDGEVGCTVNLGNNCVHFNLDNLGTYTDHTLGQRWKYICMQDNTQSVQDPKGYWGDYVFTLPVQPTECADLTTGNPSEFLNYTGVEDRLNLEEGTVQERGMSGKMKTVSKGLKIRKEACNNYTTTTIAGRMDIPPGSEYVDLLFGIAEPCDGDCAPFMVAVFGSDDALLFRWCWNRQGELPEIHCDKNFTVPDKTWQKVRLDVSEYVSDSENSALELAVYTSGDFANHKPTVNGEPGGGGKATVLVDTLLFGPNRREAADISYEKTAYVCRNSMLGEDICGKHAWCFDKYRCKQGFCTEAKGRCNKKANCFDDSDEVGCSNYEGFHGEFMLNHAKHLHTWIQELEDGLHSGIFDANVSLRVLDENINYDHDDIWERFRVRDNFAAIWRGNISILNGAHNFDYGGPGYRELRMKGVHTGFTWDLKQPCPTVGEQYGCGGHTFPEDIYEVTLIYIQATGQPSMKFRWWGRTTQGQEKLVWEAPGGVNATMTGSSCSTMSCRSGLAAKQSVSKLLCKDVPCNSNVDTPTCCANQYKAVVAGEFFTCALTIGGRPLCWGTSKEGPNTQWLQHPGPFIDFSVRGEYLCGVLDPSVNPNNPSQIDCWKPNSVSAKEVEFLPEDIYTSVSVGTTHACALRDTGFAACNGLYNLSSWQAIPMNVMYRRIVAGNNYTCALSYAYSATCWGEITKLQAYPPTGTYKSLEAGRDHACGIFQNGTAVCWGRNTNNQTIAPSGEFIQVAPGVEHTCGVKVDNSVVCWGSNAFKESDPPVKESFDSVSCGWHHTCGIRKHDKEVVCWGSNTMDGEDGVPIWTGQSEPPMADNNVV
jgi:hypothetical protein